MIRIANPMIRLAERRSPVGSIRTRVGPGAWFLAVLVLLAALGLPLARLCHAGAHDHAWTVSAGPAVIVAVATHDESTCLLCQSLAARHDVAGSEDASSDAPIAALIGLTISCFPARSWSATLTTKEARGPPIGC